MTRDWWFSCTRFTVWVQERYGIVIDGAPLIARWVGTPIRCVADWLRRIGGFRWARLDVPSLVCVEQEWWQE